VAEGRSDNHVHEQDWRDAATATVAPVAMPVKGDIWCSQTREPDLALEREMIRLFALLVGILCGSSLLAGAAVANVWYGQLPAGDLIARFGFGSAGLGVGILASIPIVLYAPAKWLIEEMW
jgi:hypothetical protein